MRLALLVLMVLFETANAQNLPYTNQTDIGILVGDGVTPSFTAQVFNGVQISKWKLKAGLITGVDFYQQILLVPVAAGIKWTPFEGGRLRHF